MIGIIKKKTDRGFGFISIEGEEKDLFFHSSALVGVTFDQLQEGAKVTFEIENGDNGRQRAKNVKLAEEGATSAPEASEKSEPAEAVETTEEDSKPEPTAE